MKIFKMYLGGGPESLVLLARPLRAINSLFFIYIYIYIYKLLMRKEGGVMLRVCVFY
jgi:hypothetical protein